MKQLVGGRNRKVYTGKKVGIIILKEVKKFILK